MLVEVLGLSYQGGESGRGLRYRRAAEFLGTDQSPDQAAAALGGVKPGRSVVCHSTSWRWEAAGAGTQHTEAGRGGPFIVLTYAVVPDLEPGAEACPVPRVGVLCSGRVEEPTPEGLHEHHVVAHAVRHLAYLAAHDPGIGAASGRYPEVWAAVSEYAVTVVVAPHAGLPAHVHDGASAS